jgi:hypothetical protein
MGSALAIGIPIANIKGPLLQEAEGQTDIPVGIVKITKKAVVDVDLTNGADQRWCEDAELRQRL